MGLLWSKWCHNGLQKIKILQNKNAPVIDVLKEGKPCAHKNFVQIQIGQSKVDNFWILNKTEENKEPDATLMVVPTMALVTQIPSDPSIQFKKYQLCYGLAWIWNELNPESRNGFKEGLPYNWNLTLYLSSVRARRVNTLTLTVRDDVNKFMLQYKGPNIHCL